MARRTLARREPRILYRLELSEGGHLNIRAWEANSQGRMNKDRFFGEVSLENYNGKPPAFTWLLSDETDELNSLPDEVTDFICKIDDLCREFLDSSPNFKQSLADYQARQSKGS